MNNNEHRVITGGNASKWRAVAGYSVAVVAAAAVAGIVLELRPTMPELAFRTPYILLIGLIAYFFGRGPGIAAFVSSVVGYTASSTPLLGYRLARPFSGGNEIEYVIFISVCLVSLIAMTSLRNSRLRIAERTEQLEAEGRERKHAEEERAAANEELAAINEELRTTTEELYNQIEVRKLTEQEMAQARSEADRKTAELKSFISSMTDGVTLFGADGEIVLMNDAARKVLGTSEGAPPVDWKESYPHHTLEGVPVPLEETAVWRALHGETVRDTRYVVVSPESERMTISVSASPVKDAEGRVIGATNLFQDVTARAEVERCAEELYGREHRLSEILQQALIPSVVPYEVEGLSIAARYQPALREAQVGGDFYDIFELGEDKLGVLIGDVAGKGVHAAIHVAATRHTIRSYAYLDLNPAKIMTLTNEALRQGDSEMYNVLTAFFAVVDTIEGTMTYVCAGHEPPIVCNGHGLEELAVTGPMLGIIPGAVYAERTHKLSAGDTVVMFTDGITEARHHESILFNKTGVIEHLKKACHTEPEEIAETLLSAATQHAGGSLQDDAAIVVLRVPK